MTKINDGGPAFPATEQHGLNSGVSGMTLRDYFAAKAMIALLSTITEFPDEHWRTGVAIDAYKMADAMLAESSKS